MNRQLIREWVRVSYHCPVTLHDYFSMDHWSRFEVNQQLDELIDATDVTVNPPRQLR